MAELSPGERRSVMRSFLGRARVNWAHLAIAQLMREGFVDRVLTTNFDPLVIKACAMMDVYPAIYDFASDHQFNAGALPELAVFYLHGQGASFVQMHTEREVREHTRRLEPIFHEAGVGRTWVVVGYSGSNDPVFEHLAEVPIFDHWLYWVGFQNRAPMQHVREKLLKRDKYAALISGYDADGFFVKLAQKLSCFPPEFVRRPFSFMKQQLERITPYAVPAQESSIDVMGKTLSLLQKVIEVHENSDGALDLETHRLLLQGDYAGVLRINVDDESSSPTAEARAWARLMLGNEYASQAGDAPDAEARRLRQLAIKEYEKGIALAKCDAHLLTNWGALLVQAARSAKDDERERLLDEAEAKYLAALACAPGFINAYNNHATLLAMRGDLRVAQGRQEEAVELFDRAEQILTDLVDKYPDLFQPRLNRGSLLVRRVIALQATTVSDQRLQIFRRSESDLRAALALEPDLPNALEKLGLVLIECGKLGDEVTRNASWREAGEVLAVANTLEPGRGSYNLACLAGLRREANTCVQHLEDCRTAKILPAARYLDTDPDLENVRATPSFRAFRKSVDP